MNLCNWHTAKAARAGILALMLGVAGPAMADPYNILLKDSGGVVQTCATGGFTFTKTTVGSFPTTAPSVNLTASAANPCFGATNARTLNTGTLNVQVANVILNGQDQGPNVVSISGNLSSGNGANNYIIKFSSDRTFTLHQNTGSAGNEPQVGSGIYFVRNTVNQVPEPESLALVVVGLGALALSGHILRRRKSPT